MSDSANLPLALRSSVQEAIDKASPWESSDQRLAREMHAKAQDLGAKISSFPEIRWASVEYDRGERTGLTRTRPQSASVIVSPEGAEPLPQPRVKMIKEFVRGAYAGMTAEDVVVTDTNASHISGHGDEDPMLKRRREEETAYEQKVLRALVGYGPIRVAAHAELDPTMEVEKATLKYDPQPTLLSAGRTHATSPAASNRASAAASASEGISNRAVSLETLETERSAVSGHSQHGMVGQQYELSKLASLQVRRVRISVGLPTSYYDKVLLQDFIRENPGKAANEMPPPTAEMLAEKRTETEGKIKAAVAQLLPLAPPGEDPYPLVHVWDYPDLPLPTLSVLGPTTQIWTWVSQSWTMLALAGLGFVSLVIARWVLIGSSGAHGKQAAPRGDERGDDAHAVGGATQQELQRMVEQHPELAAGVLRSWMAGAA